MKGISVALLATTASCAAFEGFSPQYEVPVTWGGLTVWVRTSGQVVNPASGNTYVIVLDSALQGHGVRTVNNNADSVMINPVMQGEHVVELRNVQPNCEVVDGIERRFQQYARVQTTVEFSVDCTPLE